MHADKLIWGFINRFMIWGMCSGWLIGFAIPAYLAIVLWLDPPPMQESLFDRSIFSLYPILFGIATGCIGSIVGGAAGFVNGLIIGSLTVKRFHPVHDPLVYRSLVGMISWVVTLGAAFLFCGILTMGFLPIAIMFAAIPSAVGMVASQFIASWYLRYQQKAWR